MYYTWVSRKENRRQGLFDGGVEGLGFLFKTAQETRYVPLEINKAALPTTLLHIKAQAASPRAVSAISSSGFQTDGSVLTKKAGTAALHNKTLLVTQHC